MSEVFNIFQTQTFFNNLFKDNVNDTENITFNEIFYIHLSRSVYFVKGFCLPFHLYAKLLIYTIIKHNFRNFKK